jgi:hypothetical protein
VKRQAKALLARKKLVLAGGGRFAGRGSERGGRPERPQTEQKAQEF